MTFTYYLYGQVTLGSTEHTDFYGYNGESYNPNTGLEYLRSRYYNADKGRFFQEDTYLGDIADPLTLKRYVYVKNSPLNYADPSGFRTEADVRGNEAHVTLQMLLEAVGGLLIETEYKVENHPPNASHKDYADIVFHGPLGAEVYEIKPTSYLNQINKYTDRYIGELKTLNQMGHDQRRYYIEGMKLTYENDRSKPKVTDTAFSLLPIFTNGLILPSFYDGNKFIKYKMYPSLGETGMIYYEYLNKQEERAYQKAYAKAKSIVGQIAAKCQLDPAAESIINVFPEIPGLNIDWNSVVRPPTVGEVAVVSSETLVIAIIVMILLAL